MEKTIEQKSLETQLKLHKEIAQHKSVIEYTIKNKANEGYKKIHDIICSKSYGQRKESDPVSVDKATWDLLWDMCYRMKDGDFSRLDTSDYTSNEMSAAIIKEQILKSLQ